MGLLALSACTSSATTSNGSALTITGSGSTFDAPVFDLAFAKYQHEHPGVTIRYSAVGSSAGIAAFSAQHADFGATDVPLTAAEQAAAQGGSSVQIPVDLGAEVIVYNVVIPGGGRLRLTGQVIARIFLGQITRWNDPAIAALNPGAELPRDQINVVHRSDGSGTTYIFSDYLSSVDPTWASRLGAGRTIDWPVGVGEEGNAGVGSAVSHTPFSIGATRQAATPSRRLPRSKPTLPRNPPSRPPTSPSSMSQEPIATPFADTAGRSSTPTRETRP